MNIHTSRLVDPVAWVVAQVTYLRHFAVRFSGIASKDNRRSKQRFLRWLAICIITVQDTWPEKLARVHKLVSEAGSPRLIGATCQAEDLVVVQNRLFLARHLPAFLFPEFLRRMFASREAGARWWSFEVYTYYVIDTNPETGREELHYYGLFVEIAPSPRHFDPRQELGFEYIWRKLGYGEEFTQYMLSEDIPVELKPAHVWVAQRARLWAWCAALPVFYTSALLARMAWSHGKKCQKPDHCFYWNRT